MRPPPPQGRISCFLWPTAALSVEVNSGRKLVITIYFLRERQTMKSISRLLLYIYVCILFKKGHRSRQILLKNDKTLLTRCSKCETRMQKKKGGNGTRAIGSQMPVTRMALYIYKYARVDACQKPGRGWQARRHKGLNCIGRWLAWFTRSMAWKWLFLSVEYARTSACTFQWESVFSLTITLTKRCLPKY